MRAAMSSHQGDAIKIASPRTIAAIAVDTGCVL